jgi:hypothetical protein
LKKKDFMHSRGFAVLLVATLAAAGGSLILTPSPAGARLAQRWAPRTVPGGHFAWSSPAIADVSGDGSNDVVVGGLDGKVYAWDAAGNVIPGWPAAALAAVASSPAVGDLDGDGANEVVVGTGSIEVPNQNGGVSVFNRGGGAPRCNFKTPATYGINATAVFNAPAIGDVDGDGLNDIVFGTFNQDIYVLGGNCQQKGLFNNTDSVWSAPALYDVDGDGSQEIFIGGDATASSQGLPHSGGYYRSLGWKNGGLFERWRRLSDETFQNAGAIGDVDGDGRLEVVTGTGADYCRNQQPGNTARCEASRKVWAFHLSDGSDVSGWPKSASYTTFLAAPALGDIDGDGKTDVVVGSTNYQANPFKGAVDAFLGNGRTVHAEFNDEVVAPPIVADVNGGPSEVVVGTEGQVYVLGSSLDKVESGLAVAKATGLAHKSAAAVGELGPGRWALVSASWDPSDGNRGYLHAYDIPAPAASPWPQFRKNARRLGADSTDALPVKCTTGYRLVAADGGVFAFGDAGFSGSTGNMKLNQPIVGAIGTPSGKGYWFVARDGGVFSFGDAGFKGSTANIKLNSPIVGMAATTSGKGYWLVAADGGIFNFGDASFRGSTGNLKLNSPMVGMAATTSGKGYWLVAADGGIFNFGDAGFHGSTGNLKLNSPIVGMSATQKGQGYWFVAADGGIFNFGDAGFHGSTGNLKLNRPVVGMQRTSSGDGYWFAANDGGIFSFGDAEFCGSTGRIKLNVPVVAMTS